MQVTGCRMGGQHYDVDEHKHNPATALVFSQGGLKFHQSWLFGPPFHRSSSSKLPCRREKLVNNHHPIIMSNDEQKSGNKQLVDKENKSNDAHCPGSMNYGVNALILSLRCKCCMYHGRMKGMDERRLYALLICWLSQDMEFRNIKTHVG